MSKVISTVHLFSLNVDRRGNIHMSATRSFFEVLRSKLGSVAGSTLRSGTFDFCEVRKSQFVGSPDERNAASVAEGQRLATHILSIYRSILLFEKVFAETGSYDRFVLFNHRSPSFKDMQQMAKVQNIYVPFMELPYKADLRKTPLALATVITESVAVKKLSLPVRTVETIKLDVQPQKARVLVAVKRSASNQQLHDLAARFGRDARKSV